MTEPHAERPQPTPAPSSPSPRSAPVSGAGASGSGGSGGGATPRGDGAARPAAMAGMVTADRVDGSRPAAAAAAAADHVAALWLAMSQRIAARTAHEVKNALNAVAVNLEVVRSRLARAAADSDATPQPSPAAAARFADVASIQLEALSALAEALLALARAPREPADLQQLLAPLVVVFDAVARSDGGSLKVAGSDGGAAVPVAVPSVVARLALAAALDTAVGRGRAVTCVVDGTSTPPRVYLSWLGAVPATAVSADLVAALRDCGVTVAPDAATSAAGALTLVFAGAAAGPAAAAGPTARPDAGDASSHKDQ